MPRPLDAGAPGQVFASYCHADTIWLQRFNILLKPLLKNEHLNLWTDREDIRVGDAWDESITHAIAASQIALVLVSADYLASEYITDHELPTLARYQIPLAAVLIGDCFWQTLPTLARVQWLHDPGRDGPLNIDSEAPGRRDRRIREACTELRNAIVSRPAPHRERRRLVAPTAEIKPANLPGRLHGVPQLPWSYVDRPELPMLVQAMSHPETSGVVGLAERPVSLGVYGQGGSGKSVVAAAVGNDPTTRLLFPDGIFWITVGEEPDLLALQINLLTRIGFSSGRPQSISEGVDLLREVLAERRALLIVDDVWSDAAAQAFDVTGPLGRLLYTSRDSRNLDSVNANIWAVGALPIEAATALASKILRRKSPLPPSAEQALVRVGCVALAVALVAAAVRAGRTWESVAKEFEQETDMYGEHPYAETFRAMRLAVATIPHALSAALHSLAVFPPDTRIPRAAINRYWAHTRNRNPADVNTDLSALAAAELLRYEGDTIYFHDLQHDYLVLHSKELAVLDAELLDCYRELLPNESKTQWWQLPHDEPYIAEHLTAHLARAGERRNLTDTATDPAFVACRISSGGTYAAAVDLARAATASPTQMGVRWWQRWLMRHDHLFDGASASDTALERMTARGRTAATLLAWLAVDKGRPAGIDTAHLQLLSSYPRLVVRSSLQSLIMALRRVFIHRPGIGALSWSPNEPFLAAGGLDGRIVIWDTDSNESRGPIKTLVSDEVRIIALKWSPSGQFLASAGKGHICIWDIAESAKAVDLSGILEDARAIAWAPDESKIVVGGASGCVVAWLAKEENGSRRTITIATVRTESVAWSPDGSWLAFGHANGNIFLVSAGAKFDSRIFLDGHNSSVKALEWSNDSSTLASCSIDRRVLVWRKDDEFHRPVTLLGHTHQVEALTWSPDGRRLATGGVDGRVLLWNPTGGVEPTGVFWGNTGWVGAVSWSPDGSSLATDGGDRRIFLWTVSGARPLEQITGHNGWIGSASWSPRGSHLATGGHDGRVLLWDDSASDEPVRELRNHENWVSAMAWSPDGRQLATCAVGGQIMLRDVRAGQTRVAYPIGRLVQPNSVSWSPDGSLLAVGDTGGRVNIIDPTEADVPLSALSLESDSQSRMFRSASWSPRDDMLATGMKDGRVLLWNMNWGDGPVRSVALGNSNAHLLQWSPDGERLGVGFTDGRILVWNPFAESDLPVEIILRNSTPRAITWSGDGARIAAANDQGTVTVWESDGTAVASITLESVYCLEWHGGTIAAGQWGSPAMLELQEKPVVV